MSMHIWLLHEGLGLVAILVIMLCRTWAVEGVAGHATAASSSAVTTEFGEPSVTPVIAELGDIKFIAPGWEESRFLVSKCSCCLHRCFGVAADSRFGTVAGGDL